MQRLLLNRRESHGRGLERRRALGRCGGQASGRCVPHGTAGWCLDNRSHDSLRHVGHDPRRLVLPGSMEGALWRGDVLRPCRALWRVQRVRVEGNMIGRSMGRPLGAGEFGRLGLVIVVVNVHRLLRLAAVVARVDDRDIGLLVRPFGGGLGPLGGCFDRNIASVWLRGHLELWCC